MTPDQLVAKTLEVVLDGIDHGDLRDVEGRLSALVQDTTSRSSTQPVSIWKIDAERRMVYGWALVSTVNGQESTDRQNDVVSTDDLRDAAHDFNSKRNLGRMHEAFEGIGEIRESVVLDKGMQDALGIDLGMEGWFVGVHVKDDGTWNRMKKGELCAFSIGGTGVREPMQKMVESGAKQAERMVKGFRPGPGRVTLFADVMTLLKRYNPNQPREPAGSPGGGRWAGEGGGGGGTPSTPIRSTHHAQVYPTSDGRWGVGYFRSGVGGMPEASQEGFKTKEDAIASMARMGYDPKTGERKPPEKPARDKSSEGYNAAPDGAHLLRDLAFAVGRKYDSSLQAELDSEGSVHLNQGVDQDTAGSRKIIRELERFGWKALPTDKGLALIPPSKRPDDLRSSTWGTTRWRLLRASRRSA